MTVGKSVRLFLADGTPGGLLTAEIMNWTGHLVAAPRSELATMLKRPEISRTGIYILLGDDPEGLADVLAYIGEGDNVKKRLYEHSRPEELGGKDFWDRVIVLTSKDANLTKAHARYLESRLITLAHEARRSRLVNGTAPAVLPLPEADQSDMEFYISQARILLPVLGVNLFRAAPKSARVVSEASLPVLAHKESSPVFEMQVKKEGIVARAQEIDGEFTVLEGSQARGTWIGSDDVYMNQHEKLVRDGTLALEPNGNNRIFSHDQVFSSPSAAGAVVTGRITNGRVGWRIPQGGKNYGQWQNEGVDEPVED